MSSGSVLKCLGLDEIADEEILRVIYGGTTPTNARTKLQKWLLLLPETIKAQIHAASRQERPFLPPDITPEMMAVKNSIVPSMTQMDILYRCVDFAFQANDFKMAACLVYVVDRATYWSGASRALLQVVKLIKQADPLVAIAPQVQVREARVLKDEGDLHGAMKVLNDILARRQDQPGEWKYVDEDQYRTTKAEIIKIKGHILYNMGMLRKSVEPFLESISLFTSLQKKDEKGIASCLGLLTKCLGKLSLEEFEELKQKFPDFFEKEHPCLESYIQGMKAVQHIESLHESLYSSRHLLDADTSLLKYAILSPSLSGTYALLQTILKEMKTSIGAHKTIDALGSSEQFFEFVRALFMISLTLAFSPVLQDRNVAEYVQQLSIELYLYLCRHNKIQRVARLRHSIKSVKLINISLTVLGLPSLLGVTDEGIAVTEATDYDENLNLIKQDSFKQSVHSETEREGLKQNQKYDNEEDEANGRFSHEICDSKNLILSNGTDAPFLETSYGKCPADQSLSRTEPFNSPSSSPFKIYPVKAALCQTIDTSELEGRKDNSKKEKTFRGWTYNFGHKTCQNDDVIQLRNERQTFPFVNQRKPLDPKKQWQTYKHKCVGLPVDPIFFASPMPTYEELQESEAEVSGVDEEHKDSPPLVNLSVPYIKQTLENRSKTSEKVSAIRHEYQSIVNRENTTVFSTNSTTSTERLPLHPHDIPNQPMKPTSDNNNKQTNEDVEALQFAPLIDLARTNLGDVLDVDLGKSVSTDDPVEYINSWEPPTQEGLVQGNSIHRAFLLNFNPTTSVWTSQSTLAFLGDELDLTEDKKGHCRDAFYVQFLHQDEPRGMYVGKRYRNDRHHNPKRYMQDVVCQMMAGYYVTKFNEAMQNFKRDIQVQFLPAAHLQLLTPCGNLEDCINVEPYLQGDFIKLTNNFAYANMEYHWRELATALSHFSYCESKGTLMIVDIQGWLPSEGSGVMYLTDPQFHTVGLEKFSPYDYQEVGMRKFWEKVHPRCNDMCRAIGLERSQH